jgi:large subunit ribosomal protein L17
MRHNNSGRKFSLDPDVRKAMLRNISDSLIMNGRIKTTVTRAKEIRKIAENLVTLAKNGTLHARREALSWLRTKEAFTRLFGEYAETFKTRNGGYTRITKCGVRAGDNAPMAYIEFISDNVAGTTTKKDGPKRKRRRSSSANKVAAATTGTKNVSVVKDKKAPSVKSQHTATDKKVARHQERGSSK